MVRPLTTHRFGRGVLLAFALLIAASPAALADRVRVELDKYILLKLKADADSVFIGNPAVADVVIQNTRQLFILGLTPGETSLRILDAEGKDVLATNIVVVPIEQRSVTINRNTPQRGAVELTYSCDPRCAIVRTATSVEVAATSIGSDAVDGAVAAGSDGGGGEEPLIPEVAE
jgi:pilus assembly protein CpaC